MRFEDLYPNFLQITDSDRAFFFEAYYQRRSRDLAEIEVKVTTQKERGKGRTDKKISVTKEQLQLLRQLGLA